MGLLGRVGLLAKKAITETGVAVVEIGKDIKSKSSDILDDVKLEDLEKAEKILKSSFEHLPPERKANIQKLTEQYSDEAMAKKMVNVVMTKENLAYKKNVRELEEKKEASEKVAEILLKKLLASEKGA